MGDVALLELALYRFALDRLVSHGFTPVLPPVLVREEAMHGTGFFPTERSNIYALEADGLYLTGTSEVALASLHMGEILEEAELPLRYTGFSTNFRREAGAAGKDTRGMFRVHQFNKVEMFVFIQPEASWDEHERMLELEEQFVQALGLPYRVMNVAAVVPQTLASAGLTPADLAAVGITNQRETSVVWERQTGRPVGHALVWQDRRTADFCRQRQAEEPWLRERTGLVLDPYFSATKLRWLLEQDPSVRQRAEAGAWEEPRPADAGPFAEITPSRGRRGAGRSA